MFPVQEKKRDSLLKKTLPAERASEQDNNQQARRAYDRDDPDTDTSF